MSTTGRSFAAAVPGPGHGPGLSSDGRLEELLRAGEFVVTAELAPPDSADPEDVYARASVGTGKG